MRVLGFEIKRGGRLGVTVQRAALDGTARGGVWSTIFDSTIGAWQRHTSTDTTTVQAHSALFGILTLISSDIGKLGVRLMRFDGRIWMEMEANQEPPIAAVLRKPNKYQTRMLFFVQWVLSLLQYGNAYILKERNTRGQVVALHVLDPQRVTPLISETSGDVFYQLGRDDLARVQKDIPTAPASEVIHNRINCLFHPLIGVSPIFACGLAAQQGLAIQGMSAKFFENGARPSGVLSAPGIRTDQEAKRLKDQWQDGFSGDNAGRVAVLTADLKYTPLVMNAVDADLIKQLKMSAEMVCSAFHVPGYKVGVGPMPTYQNAEVLNQIYYTDCLQGLIEGIEAALDEGFELGLQKQEGQVRVEFDLDDLLRMDTATKVKSVADAIGAGFMSPNEGRAKFNLPPVRGGWTPYLQQQNYSLAALDKRDRAEPPPAPTTPTPEAAAEQEARELLALIARGMSTHE